MTGVEITCGTCHRRWRLALTASPYLLADLSSRPCPSCESATLSCREAASPPEPERPGRRPGAPRARPAARA